VTVLLLCLVAVFAVLALELIAGACHQHHNRRFCDACGDELVGDICMPTAGRCPTCDLVYLEPIGER
jgi:hypothetical protein